ncbi:MAG: cobalamin B12-binding domain-containing protein, partial [Ktedonobacterales bacterium]
GVVRAQLEGLFRSAGGAEEGPMALVGCAPGGLHELGPLMLALFLRRAGIRVAFLGQNVEPAHLVATVAELHPACVALSACIAAEVAQLRSLGERLGAGGQRAPLFCFGGRAFNEAPELTRDMPGVYLCGDGRAAVSDIKKRMAC